MGRKRIPLKKRWESTKFVVRFKHPLRKMLDPDKRAVRLILGTNPATCDADLALLNRVFLNPDHWENPPAATFPGHIRKLWLDSANVGPREIFPPALDEARVAALAATGASDYWQMQAEKEKIRAEKAEKIITRIHGQKIRSGPSPSLGDAKADWIAAYKGHDAQHTNGVRCELDRFVKCLGAGRDVDSFIGRELEIKNYLSGLKGRAKPDGTIPPVSPGRRNQIRLMILRFLEDAGATLDREAVPAAGVAAVRAARGPVRWLERGQALALAEKLPSYWSQVWRVQVGLGLRPEELPSLHRDCFSQDCTEVTLTPRAGMTLKTGPRSINVPEKVREIVVGRLEACEWVFPAVAYVSESAKDGGGKFRKGRPRTETNLPWKTMAWFDRAYLRMLRAAKDAVNADDSIGPECKIQIHLDARVGRRTCASLLLRKGHSVEQVARMLGDNPATISEHYARIISKEVDPSAAAI